MAQADSKPRILLVSLELQPFFDESYATLLDALHSKTTVQRAKTAQGAIRQLTGGGSVPIQAVLVTDAALVNDAAHTPVWDAVLKYVRTGGTAIIMGHFSSFAHTAKLSSFFNRAGLEWKSGDYLRTETGLNRAAVGDMADRLPQKYSQKALSVDNVIPGDVWYASDPDSMNQSFVFAVINGPSSGHRPGQAAVALAKVGEGKLGYLGDVNAEDESNTVVLAMCGLL